MITPGSEQERLQVLHEMADIVRHALESEGSEDTWLALLALQRHPLTRAPLPMRNAAGVFQAQTCGLMFRRPETLEQANEAVALLAILAAGGQAWGAMLGHAIAAMQVSDVVKHGGFAETEAARDFVKALAVRGELADGQVPIYLARTFVIDEGHRSFQGDWIAPPLLGSAVPGILNRRFTWGDDEAQLQEHVALAWDRFQRAGAFMRPMSGSPSAT